MAAELYCTRTVGSAYFAGHQYLSISRETSDYAIAFSSWSDPPIQDTSDGTQ